LQLLWKFAYAYVDIYLYFWSFEYPMQYLTFFFDTVEINYRPTLTTYALSNEADE